MGRWVGTGLAAALVALLGLPLVALVWSSSPATLVAGASHPMFSEAVGLSLRTSLWSLAIMVVGGTPLAWWLARGHSRLRSAVRGLVHVPIIIPPAVIGVSLLLAYGRRGLLGEPLDAWGIELAFSETGVILAQVVVAAPFYVQGASNAFAKVSTDMLIVARTLGASSTRAFFQVAVPIALPGLVAAASLGWARALGEFGATLLFAGNLPGETQTVPLAILAALETDLRVATAFALLMSALGVLLLAAMAAGPRVFARWARRPSATQRAERL